jgi:hypothetical protein
LIHIKLGKVLAHPVFIERDRLGHGSLANLGPAKVEHFVDLIAVNRQRHTLPEANILEDLFQHGIIMGLVESQTHVITPAVIEQVDFIVASLFILYVEREVFDR